MAADTPGPGELPPPPFEPGEPAPQHSGTARGYDRVPPHSLEAEVSVLGAALLSRAAATEIVELLNPEDFYRSAHRIVFESIQDLMNKSDPVDPVTLLDHLVATDRLDQVGGAVAVQGLAAAVPTAANASYYARIVSDKALMRKVIEAGTEIVGIGYEPTEDPKAAVNQAESVMFDVAEGRVASEAVPLSELLNPAFEEIERRYKLGDDVIGLPTGFKLLDRITSGFQPQQLIVLAARPAMGKTTLAMSMAHYMTAQLKRPVAFFTLEMSKEEIVMRMLSSEAMIDGKRIKTGQLEDTDWRKLADALGTLADAPLYIDDSPNITMLEIMSKCRRLKQRGGLDLIIVDYLQLMSSHKKVENRQQEVAEISRAMKMLAKELNIPVIALSQLNRGVETRTDKRPMLADLRESGSVEQDADIVMFVYRDEVYDPESPDQGVAELIISKHRNGATGTVKLAFLGHVTKFANLARGPGFSGPSGPPDGPPPMPPPPTDSPV